MASSGIDQLGRIPVDVARDWIKRVAIECGYEVGKRILREITEKGDPRFIDVIPSDYPRLIMLCDAALREKPKPQPSDGIRTTLLQRPDQGPPYNLAVSFEGLNDDEARSLIDFAIKLEQTRNGTVLTPTEYGNRFSGLEFD